MSQQQQITPEELAIQLRPTFEKYHVLRAILFGSFARGEGTHHSDVDLVILQQTAKRFLDRYEGVLSEIIQAIPGRDVDLFIYTPKEFAQMRHRPWGNMIVREGKIIYESECELS